MKRTLVAQATLICLASWVSHSANAASSDSNATADSPTNFGEVSSSVSQVSPQSSEWLLSKQNASLSQPSPQISAAVLPGERLSDWILRTIGPTGDTTALHWRVAAERAPQGRLRDAVIESLRGRFNSKHGAEYNSPHTKLSEWVQSFPLTGRLTVAIADARWLQAAPLEDPIMLEGQSVVVFPRPKTVVVIGEDGVPCSVPHQSGALARDYIRACRGAQNADSVDWVWIAQPDGRTQRYGISPWNQEQQDEPGPGAWVWAPGRQSGISDSVSDNLIRFLATQAPGDAARIPASTKVEAISQVPQRRYSPRSLELTASDWGEIGVLQTPTARMEPAGSVRLHVSRVDPYTRGTFMFQPLDWLEAGFRYTDIGNRLYGPTFAGDQTLKDKSIDFKIRLLEESHLLPAVAVGVRDFGGTGLFSGEYVVAGKRWGNFDASLGLGWGYLGARGNIKNPLGFLGSGFDTRVGNTTLTGGTANFQSLFRGPAALFGGLQWHSPYNPLVLKLELDGNDYQHEADDYPLAVRSPINVGVTYRYSSSVDLSLAYERGNRLMFGLTLHGNLGQLYSPKLLDPSLALPSPMPPLQPPAEGWGSTAQMIERFTGWTVRSITHTPGTTTVEADTDAAIHLQERVQRAIAVLHRDTPASSTRFVFKLSERGLALSNINVDRAEWVALNTRTETPALRLPAATVQAGTATAGVNQPQASDNEGTWRAKPRGFNAEFGPSYSQILGGPDGFLLYQLGAQTAFEQRFSDSTWLSGVANYRLLDNYANFQFDGPSSLPRVRTDQRKYVTTSAFTIPLLQLTHVSDLGRGHYASGYAGMLEFMYGGVGAEWLYRPWQGALAFGVDINAVRQRGFDQKFAFRDYSVGTGHATLYWDTGWNDLQVKLSAGRYLAGDVGATLDVKRVFSNGVSVGAWATKTNVSAEDFGEGSFDKGIYVNVPFDVMLPKSTSGGGTIAWSPLSRDGGARLNRSISLYDLTRQRDARAFQWRQSKPTKPTSAENTTYVLSEPNSSGLEGFGTTTATLGHQLAGVPASTWLMAGGAVLVSSLLDRRADSWAANHQSGTIETIGSVSNALPIGLALGAGLLHTGVAGEAASTTAATSLKAAAYTFGANALTRYAVGRARPTAGVGSTSFDGFNSAAVQSGFPSNHVAIAFALATPFAQQHDMPWLYAVAAASGFGRVQKREHWVSDTVAGAFMGYAIGSMLTDQQRHNQSGMQLSVTPESVTGTWTFK